MLVALTDAKNWFCPLLCISRKPWTKMPRRLKVTKLEFWFHIKYKCCWIWAVMWKMCGSLCIHLPYKCQDEHGSWKPSSWKLILVFKLQCSLMWLAASVHNNYDINTLTLTPELQYSHTHRIRRTVIQVPLTTEKVFTRLHLQTGKKKWGAEFKRVMRMVQKSWRSKRIKARNTTCSPEIWLWLHIPSFKLNY